MLSSSQLGNRYTDIQWYNKKLHLASFIEHFSWSVITESHKNTYKGKFNSYLNHLRRAHGQ